MELSSALLKSFAQVTNDEPEESSAGTAYGTLYVQSDGNYVLLDGGTSLTPVVMATDSRDGDRVVVTIENHVATVTSNITTPSSGYVAIETETSLMEEISYAFELAYDEAADAAVIANGKTRAYYQTSAPSGSSFTTNDIWFDTDDGYRMYFWNGSAWVSAQFGSGALGDGSVVASTIASEAITTGKIASGAVTTVKLAANCVTAAKIDVEDLFAQNITATGTITGVTLKAATGEFTGDVVATTIKAYKEYNIYVGVAGGSIDSYITVISGDQDSIHVGYNAGEEVSNGCGFDIDYNGDIIAYAKNGYHINGEVNISSDLYVSGDCTVDEGQNSYMMDGNLYFVSSGTGVHFYASSSSHPQMLAYYSASDHVCVGVSTHITVLYGTEVILGSSGAAVTSDRKLKSDIASLSSRQTDLFDMLTPRVYTLKANPDEKHFGFIVDEVENAMLDAGLNPEEYALTDYFTQDPQDENDDNAGETYGAIRYEEIIPILVYEVQELKAQLQLLTN